MYKKLTEIPLCRCTYHKGKLYCLAKDLNLLFSIDLQDGSIDLMDAVPGEDVLSSYLSGSIAVWNHTLILAPNKTKKIWLYDLITKQWNGVPIKEADCRESGGFYQTYIWNNKAFLIGGGYPAIICLDLEKNTCDHITKPYKEMMDRNPDSSYLYFRPNGVRIEDTLYLASCLDNYVLTFDMASLEHQWIKIGPDSSAYSGIAWDGTDFWLSPRSNNDIIRWDGRENVKAYPLPDEFSQHSEYVWDACFDGRQMVFPAVNHERNIQLDPENDSLHVYDEHYTLFKRLDNGIVVRQNNNADLTVTTEIHSVENSSMEIHSVESFSEKVFPVSVEADRLRQFYEERNLSIYKENTLYYETAGSQMLSLKGFLNFANSGFQHRSDSDGTVGQAIWEKIR